MRLIALATVSPMRCRRLRTASSIICIVGYETEKARKVTEINMTTGNLVCLDGKVALIIGASSGIGRAPAEMCAEAGAEVMVADIDEVKGPEVADAINDRGGTAVFTRVDATDERSVADSISATVQRFSRLQVLVNTAGTADLGSAPGQAWHDSIDLFLRGPCSTCLHAVDEIERAGGGSIVNVASIAGVTGSVSADVAGTGYGSAKHGLVGFARTMALAYAKRNIRVNAVAPGRSRRGSPSSCTRILSESPGHKRGFFACPWIVGVNHVKSVPL